MNFKQKLLIVILASQFLTGCIPAAFVVGATAGGAIVYDKRTVKTMTQDQEVNLKAITRLNEDPQLKNTHISVAVFNHIVLLVGQAPAPDQSQRAYDIVSGIPHVKRVYNQITVESPTSASHRAKDTWITTKAKTMMLAEKGLNSTQIKVITENNVVYLMGLVTRNQGNLAALVASKVAGVQKVVKLFEYQS